MTKKSEELVQEAKDLIEYLRTRKLDGAEVAMVMCMANKFNDMYQIADYIRQTN